LAEPDQHHPAAITTRPLLSSIARRTQRAGRVTLTISSTHGKRGSPGVSRIVGFHIGAFR
jgi:hypothetical protein